MTKLFEILGTFFAGTTLIVYICIFLGKILEVTLCTLRIVLINRGERAIGALLALIEITLWLIIAGNVLSNYQSDPWKMVAYALAYSLGNYAGSWLEERLAFGLCSIQRTIFLRMSVSSRKKNSDWKRRRLPERLTERLPYQSSVQTSIQY